MRYSIANQQINFYVEHGYIDFEDLLPEKLMESCRKDFEKIVQDENPNAVYLKGRDLWRKITSFQKLAKNRHIASIVQQLCKQSKLRLAFDQISISDFPQKDSLGSLFSFQNLVCIAVFYLDSKENSCTFINPKYPFIPKENSSQIYVVGYGSFNTLYVANNRDANIHYLKKFGYTFGDLLKEEFHPTLCLE